MSGQSPQGGHGQNSHDPSRFLLRARKNEEQMIAFAIAMISVAAVIIIFQWARPMRRIAQRTLAISVARTIRRWLIRPTYLLPSVGHGILVAVYLAINAILTITNTDPALTAMANLSSRTGWMAIANLAVAIILALKNTPLAVLTPWSYERLNILHQVSGSLTVVFVVVHASLYTTSFTMQGRPERLLETAEIYGWVAGASFVILGIAGAVIRRWFYEIFYYVHITFWVVGLVTTGLHQPELTKKVVYVVAILGGMWLFDRAIRLTRLATCVANTPIIVTPLSDGATRVTMLQVPFGARAGKHCFLWIPKVRLTETHPFTIVSTDRLEFVVTSHNGFTSKLHKFAKENPGARLRASVDGSYGTIPDPVKYNKVVFVAGGSGITFTLGTAMEMLQKMGPDEKKEIVFHWIVRSKGRLRWFADQLKILQADRRFRMKLHVTRHVLKEAKGVSPVSSIVQSPYNATAGLIDLERDGGEGLKRPPAYAARTVSSGVSTTGSSELPSPTGISSPIENGYKDLDTLPISYGRPQVTELVDSAMLGTTRHDRVLVMACGPPSLREQVRLSTSKAIVGDGPTVEFHCESYGW